MLFPVGLFYDKENGKARTTEVNCFFQQDAVHTMLSEKMQKILTKYTFHTSPS